MSNEWVSADVYHGLPGYRAAGSDSTVGHVDRLRKGKCIAKNHTCKGWATKTSKYCAGHEKALVTK
jgi:hypothetical protein